MTRTGTFTWLLSFGLVLAWMAGAGEGLPAAENKRPPNFVIIFTDDQGYADVGCFGAQGFETPNLDRMAREGRRFTNFVVGQAVCSASRVALLTGCYPQRVSILGALGPRSPVGINQREVLLPELLKPRGYATCIVGKWHLGDHPRFLPTRHGFDEYFGIPYSNDMWPFHPGTNVFPPLPLLHQERVVAVNPDQHYLTTWYTEYAVDFIRRNRNRPFFLYLAHNMPHVPLFVSEKFRGKSKQGLYGDVIMEIDWSVGRILDTLRELQLDRNTLVIFTSDNGPWLSYGNHAGSAGPLREGKGTTWEGGHREPCIMWWPGRVPAGTECREFCATLDLLPTLARLAGASLPEHKIDGHDIWPLISGQPGAKSPWKAFYYYYYGYELQAVRSGRWKLHFPHRYRTLAGEPGRDGLPGPYKIVRTGLELYDLETDVGERHNVADKHPEVVRRLQALAEEARRDLGDSLTGRKGRGVRPPGRVEW